MSTQENCAPSTQPRGMQTSPTKDSLVTIRVQAGIETRSLSYVTGISARTTGAKSISMHLVVIPPRASATAHVHQGFETAIYMLKGRVETRFGPGLRDSVINGPGDFIFIPAGLPHQPINLSDTEDALAIVSRNNANQEETVVSYDPAATPI